MPLVFVSHSTHDREFVEKEIIPLLEGQGVEAWYSKDSIVPADQWERTILKGLKACDAFLLVMSPRSAQSTWVKREVDWIFNKGGKTIIPVLLQDCEADDFHIGMVSLQHVDFSKNWELGRKKLLQALERWTIQGKKAHSPKPERRLDEEVPTSGIGVFSQYPPDAILRVSPGGASTKSLGIKPERKPGEIFTNNLGMKFAWIPPGTFEMGSGKFEKGRETDEMEHEVTLTKGFFMGIHLVTQEQWQAVMGSNPSRCKDEKNLPVESVMWHDCQKFIGKLRERDKNTYRLPSEAEWEYACRAGTTTPFCFGETISSDQVNYNGSPYKKKDPKGTYRRKTTPVGSFPANALGLCDMHGNLREWCADWYGKYSKYGVVDPKGPETGQYRVVRGGCFSDSPGNCRSATRFRGLLGDSHACGLRVCFCLD